MNRVAPSALGQSQSAAVLHEALKPPLQNALSSLNVQLDQELARYRHARQGNAPNATRGPQVSGHRQPNLISVQPHHDGASGRQIAGNTATVVPPPPPPNPRLRRQATDETSSTAPATSATLATQGGALVNSSVPPNDYLASSEALLEHLGDEAAPPSGDEASQTTAPADSRRLITPLGLGGLLLLLVASAGLGYVMVNPGAVRHLLDKTPIARLGSSSPNATPSGTAAPDGESANPASTTANPLHSIGPDLSQREFVDLNLSSLSTLPIEATRDFPDNIAATANAEIPDQAQPTGTAEAADNTSSQLSTVPLATQSPAAVTTAPRPRPTPSASRPAPRPTSAAPRPTPQATATQSPAPTSQTAAPATTPSPASSSASPTPTGSSASNGTGSDSDGSGTDAGGSGTFQPYYVVTDYTGDPSLTAARQVVSDAYVHNFPVGARIQLGTFDTEADARAWAQELQAQGLDVNVYAP